MAIERLAAGQAFHKTVQLAFLTGLAIGFPERLWRLVGGGRGRVDLAVEVDGDEQMLVIIEIKGTDWDATPAGRVMRDLSRPSRKPSASQGRNTRRSGLSRAVGTPIRTRLTCRNVSNSWNTCRETGPGNVRTEEEAPAAWAACAKCDTSELNWASALTRLAGGRCPKADGRQATSRPQPQQRANREGSQGGLLRARFRVRRCHR